jgi:iron(III) transport system permease protein
VTGLRQARAIAACAGAAAAAFVLLPWYSTPEGIAQLALPGALLADPESATGLAQALLFRQPLLLLALACAVACAFAPRLRTVRAQAAGLVVCGFGGALVLGLAAQLPTAHPHAGWGWGAALTLVGLLACGAGGLARAGAFKGDMLASGVAVLAACGLTAFVVYPLARGLAVGFAADAGQTGIAAAASRIANERTWGLSCLGQGAHCGVAWNTLFLALLTATGTTALGLLLALAELRGGARWARGVRLLAPLPFVTPPFMAGLALILVFGRSGAISQLLEWALGVSPSRWFYGLFGLWLAQMFAFTPVAYLILRGLLQGLNPSLEEAARTLRATPSFALRRVTLPLLLPGLAHAYLVGFLESMADFGNPIIVSGQYAVLSTEIFFAIVGAQFDQGRAAALAWILGLFALGVFVAQRSLLRGREFASTQPRAGAQPRALPPAWQRTVRVVAGSWLAATLALYACGIAAAFVQVWGRDFTPTLRHFERAFEVAHDMGTFELTGPAWSSLGTTLRFAALAALLTTGAGFLLAWLLERNRFPGRAAVEFTLLAAFAIPGTVLGLSYTLVFNRPPIEITGTGLVIVLCFFFRTLPVSVGMGTAAFRQVDRSIDEASRVLGAPTWRTLRHVLLPLLRPAVAGSLVYGFVRSMTTVSAVVFLVTAETELATTFIIGRVGQGDYGLAFAYSTALIVLLALFMGMAQWAIGLTRWEHRVVRPSHLARGAL